MRKIDLGLYLVTDRHLSKGRDIVEIVEQACQEGVTVVQLREKDISTKEFYDLAQSLKKCLSNYKVPLIINDRIDIALAVDAEGVHIGQSDMDPVVARRLIGDDKILGLSIENEKQAYEANSLDIDYIGLSPVFSTNTKLDTAPELGLSGIKKITSISKFPAVAIGGINVNNTASIIKAGADGIAVVSAIVSADFPAEASKILFKEVENNRNK